MVIGGISDGSRLEENLVAAYLADEYSYWYRDHKRHKLYLFLFAIFCLYPHACHFVFSRWLLQLQESFQCLKQEEVVKRGWYHVFSSENAKKKKKKRPSEKLFRRLPLTSLWPRKLGYLASTSYEGRCGRGHSATPTEIGKKGKMMCVCLHKGHHHGKSSFFQNKKKNSWYHNEAKLQWDWLKNLHFR